MEEYLAGNLVIKTFNQQDQAIESIRKINQTHYQAFKKAQFMNFAIYPVIRLMNQLAFIVSAILGGSLVLSGGITLGLLQAYLQYINQISEPISTASYVINAIQSAMAAIDRIFEIMDEPNELPDSQEQHLSSPKGAIEFKEVRFGYTPDKQLMENVTISVKPKQTIAIVGPTGAGKTTLVNLLMRFYELTKGKSSLTRLTSPSYQEMSCESILGWSYSILGCLKELLPRISPTGNAKRQERRSSMQLK